VVVETLVAAGADRIADMACRLAHGLQVQEDALKTRLTLQQLPPSVNAIWRFTKGGKMYRTSEYQTWANSEAWTVSAQLRGQHKFDGPVYLTIAMKRPRANSDLDNRLKATIDLLQTLGAIANDKDVHGINAYWTADLPAGVAAEITIVEADALEDAA
jgi:Holliday junction resolvase RusA-like endonuclease